VDGCGQDVFDDDTRRVLAAEVLGRGEGAEAQRATFLARLFREGGPRAREAVLSAVGTLPSPLVLPLVTEALGDEDEGVILAGLEQLASQAAAARRARDEEAVRRTLRGEPTAETPRLLPELEPALLAAGRRLVESSSLEGRVTWAGAVEALADPGVEQAELVALLRPLAAHPSEGVREAARRALEAMGLGADGAVDAVPEPLAAARLVGLPRHAHLETDRGPVELELLADDAPTTVARFAELARAGAFDTLSFHRVVAGFVVQGGDPRGDGYGGPSWWQRCEDSPLAYERGTVGMALAGRDTGGSQFFITLGPQHHLDGRYTVFGRVIEGMEAVDQLQAGDVIRRVVVE
jgi:cyclophilin family peptidyl-prolyl cis-trans isomerase